MGLVLLRRKLSDVLGRFASKSLNYQLIILELSLIIIVVITILFVIFRTHQQVYEQNQEYVADIIDQMENNINTHLAGISNIALSVGFNEGVKGLLKAEDDLTRLKIADEVKDYLTRMKSIKNEISEIILVGEDGFSYNRGYNPELISQLNLLVQQMRKGSRPQYLGTITYNEKIELVFGNNIYLEETTLERIGYMVTLVDASIITDELARQTGEYYIINDYNEIVLSVETKERGKRLELTGDSISRENIWETDMDLRIIGFNRNSKLYGDMKKTIFAYIVIIGMMLLMILWIYIFFSKYTVKPLNKVSAFISMISKGDLRYLKKRMDVKGPSEVQLIQKEINFLLDEINGLTHRLVTTTSRLYSIELEKKKAELEFLKSQVNPHFLYNTLGIIRGIAALNDQQDIEKISLALTKIFRYSIKGDDIVSFRQELDIAKAYIDIQKCRFQDRFDVEYHIETHLQELKVQKMILQPIIENAVFHGIEPTSRKCKIVIQAVEVEEGIKIHVIDDGVGIERSILEKIQQTLKSVDENLGTKDHIGLVNVHARLKYYFGDDAGLRVESEIGSGTKVCMFIPSDMID